MSDALQQIADIVYERTGIRYDEAHSRSLELAIERATDGADVDAFLRLLASSTSRSTALARLVDEVTIKETSFARDPRQLATIPWKRLLASAKAVGDDTVRVWSAACATGEEPYTLGILACDAFGTLAPPVAILGTDVAVSSVQRTTLGRYGTRAIAQLDERQRTSYLTQVDDSTWEVGAPLRALVDVHLHNLVQDPPPQPGHFDLILCRNVLIYFDDSTVERVIASMERALRPGGILMLGAADALGTSAQHLARLISRERGTHATTASRTGYTAPSRRPLRRPLASEAHVEDAPHDLLAVALQAAGDGRTDTALRAATDALARDPADPEAQFVVGLIELERQDPVAAMRSFRRALSIQPAFALAAFQLGRAADLVANETAARSAYEQALRTAGSPSDTSRLPWSIAPEDLASACKARLEHLP